MRRLPLSRRRRGVSEVIGALLLIVVVVVAVASLAIFLSGAQSSAQSRSAYTQSVKNEDLQFPNIVLTPNLPNALWMLTESSSGSNGTQYYVAVNGPTSITLLQVGDSSNEFTITDFTGGATTAYIKDGANVGIYKTESEINFGGTGFEFSPAVWSNATLSVQNLNTADSQITEIQVNGNWLPYWNITKISGGVVVNATGPVAPGGNPRSTDAYAKSVVKVDLSLSYLNIPRDVPLQITVETQLGNYFRVLYSPPVPIVTSSISNEDYQVAERDILTFNGAQSTSNGSSIESYSWEILTPLSTTSAGCSASAFSSPTNLDVAYVSGAAVQYTPESLFTSTISTVCATGPIEASLTVVDTNGFVSTSNPVIIPADPNIAPPATILLYPSTETLTSCSTSATSVYVEIENILGQPVSGVGVTAIPSSGITVTPTTNATATYMSQKGVVGFDVTCSGTTSGTIEFESGNLPPIFFQVS